MAKNSAVTLAAATAGVLVAFSSLSVASPAAAVDPGTPAAAVGATTRAAKENNCFQTGSWRFWTQGTPANRPGYMTLTVRGRGVNAAYIRGFYRSYDGRTRGEINGYLNAPCGQRWSGRFDDKSYPFNEGPFVASFNRGSKTFSGWFKTHDGCNYVINLIRPCKFTWRGTKI
ncbi:MAG: hypothetical protein QG671_211 [Actinomycetota bacterium]|jgi:hypothetical protein|nr:hypothetical protein [Actinomycetota bacterium]